MFTSTPRAPARFTPSSSGQAIACSAAMRARSMPLAAAEPIIAMPCSDITVRTSWKSTLTRPGLLMISAMPATALFSTSSAALNASSCATPGPDGKVMMATFELDGEKFHALNGGPQFKFNEALSLFVNCETQEEIDEMWSKLSAGGEEGQCGWLKDKFGLSWQIVPPVLGQLMGDKDRVKANRVLQAMLKMRKIDIKTLKQAYEQS